MRIFSSTVILFFCIFCSGSLYAEENVGNFAVRAVLPTPVYSVWNIPALYYAAGTSSPQLKLDKLGHLRELEYIALPETKFMVRNILDAGSIVVYEVTTVDYTKNVKLYIDARFVAPCADDAGERVQKLPEKYVILSAMSAMIGQPYRWGGNYYQGIVEMAEFYPAGSSTLSGEMLDAWLLKGVDCSGLLYQASAGSTPRNTSELISCGSGVDIAGCTAEEIIGLVEPLDLIVWKGHVLYVFDSDNVIESRPRYRDGSAGGVRVHSMLSVLRELMQERVPVNDYVADAADKKRFVIRRLF